MSRPPRGHRGGQRGGQGGGRHPSRSPDRRRALEVLVQVEARDARATDLLQPGEAAFVRELVLGVLRRRLTLDAVHRAFARRPLEQLDPPVLQAVRLGLYQLLFLDGVPARAAVAESVGALPLASHRAYVNGLLRAIQRESHRVPPDRDRGGAHPSKRLERPGRSVTFFSRAVFPDPAEDRAAWLATVHSHPPWLVRRWLDQVGEDETVARLEAGNRPPPLVLRPRTGRVTADELVARLREEDLAAGVLPRAGGVDAVGLGASPRGLFRTRAFQEGLFSVQDPLQMAAVEQLAPRAGEVVWDACAAPGGKATQLGELLEGQGRVVAGDVSEARLERVRENVERLGLTDTVSVTRHDVLDPAPPPGMPEGGFDAVLLDAPCTNTAVLAARPEARWRLDDAGLASLVELQGRLIEAVLPRLRPGGRLIYSVCSLEPEEGAGHGLEATASPLVFRRTASAS